MPHRPENALSASRMVFTTWIFERLGFLKDLDFLQTRAGRCGILERA
jgi:hypothetical protein